MILMDFDDFSMNFDGFWIDFQYAPWDPPRERLNMDKSNKKRRPSPC